MSQHMVWMCQSSLQSAFSVTAAVAWCGADAVFTVLGILLQLAGSAHKYIKLSHGVDDGPVVKHALVCGLPI